MTIPARAWLATYDRTWLRGDVMAGITLAAYLLPSAIGDASLAGLPPQAGLYACLFGGLVFLVVLQFPSHGHRRHLCDLRSPPARRRSAARNTPAATMPPMTRVLLGVAMSLLLLLRRASRPRVTELGRVPGTTYFADLARHPENERVNDVLVVRNEGALLYFNIDHVRDRVAALIAERERRPRLLIFFMGNVPHVDLAGVEFLIDLEATCQRSGIEFRLAEVHGEVREACRRAHSTVGATLAEANQTVDDVVNKWRLAPSTVA